MLPNARRFLVITPALDGCDGISEVSRQVVRALLAREDRAAVETWSLEGHRFQELEARPDHAFRSARGRRGPIVRWTARRATRSCDRLTVVVMHVHLAPLGAVLAARGAPMVVFIHGVEAWTPLRIRERVALTFASRIVANSQRTADQFSAANPGIAPVVVCPLGIRRPSAVPVQRLDQGFVLIVGRLASAERYKGHDALIDAWPLVLRAVPHARLIVAGDGDDRQRLEARVAERNLTRAIAFVGRVSDEELLGLYQACAAFAMPSSGEGFGLVYLEAMREGKPCIGLRAASEIIQDGRTGLLLDDREPATVAAAVVRMLTDESLRLRLGSAGAATVRDFYDERHFANRFTAAVDARATPAAVRRRTLSIGV